LFTDIVGATATAVGVGDRPWAELLLLHHERVRRELARYRGREVDTAGDGFLASFDGPARAIRCASAIRDSVRELGIEVRAGLHTGECELVDGKVAGIAVHTGARVASVAQPGEVLLPRARARDHQSTAGSTLHRLPLRLGRPIEETLLKSLPAFLVDPDGAHQRHDVSVAGKTPVVFMQQSLGE
jgi:class 3 adenylate cyclase